MAAETLSVWDMKSGRQLWSKEKVEWPSAMALSSDGATVLIASGGGAVSILDRAQPDEAVSLVSRSPEKDRIMILQSIVRLDLSPDGKRVLAIHADGGTTLWHVPTRKELAFLRGPTGEESSVTVSKDWGILVTADRVQGGTQVEVERLHWPA